MIDFNHIGGFHARVNKLTESSSVADKASRGSIEALEMRLDRQNMLIQTLLMLLLEKAVINDEEFRTWLNYVDGLDGRVDGKLRPNNSPILCSSCGRNNAATAVRCQYCGQDFSAQFIDPRHKTDRG